MRSRLVLKAPRTRRRNFCSWAREKRRAPSHGDHRAGQVFHALSLCEANANQDDTKRLRSKSRGSPITNQCAVRIERALISPQYWACVGGQESDTKSDG